jgi:outer membrane receptor protein involved in Fe transport
MIDSHIAASTLSRGKKTTFFLTTSVLVFSILANPALAQDVAGASDDAANAGITEIVVTAQKREESLQNVPISITAFSTKELDDMQVDSFADYAKLIPSLSFVTTGPGTAKVYFRGVASGGDGNHSGSQPSVGTYLDEQPITTIQGALDLHIYDIARVEALAGPQGTLYGASAQAGVVRIITNKPEIGEFSASVSGGANLTAHGSEGYVVEGFTNVPVGDNAAVRLVGWYQHDGGYIDNVAGTRTYPVSGITINNSAIARKDYNFSDTYGGRLALKIDLNDSWSVTPTIMGQINKSEGIFGYDLNVGELAVTHFLPETYEDKWLQAALLIEGKVGGLDLTYSGSYLKRQLDVQADYTDYSFFYDPVSGASFVDANGNLADPSQSTIGNDTFSKQSHELRLATDSTGRFRFVGGAFFQEQRHHIGQLYGVASLLPSRSIVGYPGLIWLTNQQRIDQDYAVFGEASFDILPQLTATAGGRYYKYDNSLYGYVGFRSAGNNCIPGARTVSRSPVINGNLCSNLDKSTKGKGFLPKLNLTYKIEDLGLVYATYSEGFRPGGVNRRAGLPAYRPDKLINYELGFKTTFADNRVRLNGAVFYEKWQDMQLAFLGLNGLTTISNVGDSTVKGVEVDITLAPSKGLTFSNSASYSVGKLDGNYCKQETGNATCSGPGDSIQAPKGTRLPVAPKFKFNSIARYEFDLGSYDAHLQGSYSYQSSHETKLTTAESLVFGTSPGFSQVDFSAGVKHGNTAVELWAKNLFDVLGDVSRYAECATAVCGGNKFGAPGKGIIYRVPIVPRQIGIRVTQDF